MVDVKHFERVRIVQDKTIDSDAALPPEEEGTKVLVDVLEAGEDSLFPLQGALGYEIYQLGFPAPSPQRDLSLSIGQSNHNSCN
ncbi:MAG: hypothetical protein WAR21_12110 [Candidatus Acidiferrales bacterium]|jgi:hypothetical protein